MGADLFLIGTVMTNHGRFITNRCNSCYYKSGQWLLQIGTTFIIANRGKVIENWGRYYKIYCKLGQLLQIGAIITNYDTTKVSIFYRIRCVKYMKRK